MCPSPLFSQFPGSKKHHVPNASFALADCALGLAGDQSCLSAEEPSKGSPAATPRGVEAVAAEAACPRQRIWEMVQPMLVVPLNAPVENSQITM